jgi:hypothetical protein
MPVMAARVPVDFVMTPLIDGPLPLEKGPVRK